MKRQTFTSIAEVRAYAQARFPPDTPFSRMSASEKSYANVCNMTLADPSLAALKQSLQASGKNVQSATREKIYTFFADRIVESKEDPKTVLAAVQQELVHILEQLQSMQPLAPADTPMDDSEHEQWTRAHTEIGLLVDQARNFALWLVPEQVTTMLRRIDEQCTALYSGDAELSEEENRLYSAAKAEDNVQESRLCPRAEDI
jgi:hypothetical protein